MIKKYLSASLLCLVVGLCLNGSLAAQSIVTGGIAGVITDPTGAVVTGANLTLKNPANGDAFNATSSGSGDYIFALLKPGNYTLGVSKDGFKTTTRTVTVVLGSTVTANLTVELGSGSTTVEVSAVTGPELQTENANISTNYETKQIQEIPNPGGDVTYIAQTAPGVTMNSSSGGGYGITLAPAISSWAATSCRKLP